MSILVRPGDIWRDLDPRGGPRFRVITVDERYAHVTRLDGKFPRQVLLERFRNHANYRSGYALVSREWNDQ